MPRATKPAKQSKPLTSAERRVLIKAGAWPLKKANKPAKIKKHIAAPASPSQILKWVKLSKTERRKVDRIVADVKTSKQKPTKRVVKKPSKQVAKLVKRIAKHRKVIADLQNVTSAVTQSMKNWQALTKQSRHVQRALAASVAKREAGERAIVAEWNRKGATLKSVARVAHQHGLEAHIQLTPSQPVAPAGKPVTLGEAIDLIRRLSYDDPSLLRDRLLIVAREMEKLDLVEHDPTAPHVYRPTERGALWRNYMKDM